MKHKINYKTIKDDDCSDHYCTGHSHIEYSCDICGKLDLDTIDFPSEIYSIYDKMVWITLWHNVEIIQGVEYGRGVFGDPMVAGKTIR